MKEDGGVTPTLSSDVTGTGTVYIRINIPEINVQKCLQFQLNESVWKAKQRVLATFAKDLRDGLNYGFYCPPINGRAGKFLEEERLLREYPLKGPIGFLEFKYKRRVYKLLQIRQSKIKQLHTKACLKEFIQFVKHSHVDKIQRATFKGLDPNFHDEKTGETPLTLATTLDHTVCHQVIVSLCNGGAHLDFRNIYGLTPMHKAAIRGNSRALKALLDLGASPNYKDGRGLTPLYYSVGHDAEVTSTEMLLHERAMVGTPDEQGWYELHHACRHGRVQHLELLVFYGAEMNVQNASGNTPLHVCAVNNQESCARVLLFRGARKDIVNFSNQTAYQVAIISGNHDLALVIQTFISADVVPFRELPTYSVRRQHGTMTASMRNIMRCRSDPRINILSWDKETPVTGLNESLSDGSFVGYHSESPRLSISSSNSSGPVTGYMSYEGDTRGRSFTTNSETHANGYATRRANSVGDLCERFSQPVQLVQIPQFENHVRVVELQKGREGFGFVLRGAKSQDTSSASLAFEPSAEYPALQYLDSVDHNSNADKCGLKGGDFILEINDKDVMRASHEHVVNIIKSSGSQLRLKVVTVIPLQQKSAGHNAAAQNAQNVSLTMPSRGQKFRAPMPPKRNPGTQLSYSKGRSKSFAEGIAEIEKLDETLAKYDSDARSFSSSMEGLNKLSLSTKNDAKVASIRSTTAAKRVSCIQLDDEYSISTFDDLNHSLADRIPLSKKCSPSEIRINKYHKKNSFNPLEKSSSSPNVSALKPKDLIYTTPTVIDGYGTIASPEYRTLVTIHPDSESMSGVSDNFSSSSSNQYSAMHQRSLGVNSALDTRLLASAVSTDRNGMVPKKKTKRQPPPPPGHITIPPPPRQPAPQPPAKSEVVPISTAQTLYANVSAEIQKKIKQSAYESSFRPGTSAQMTSTPKGKDSPNKSLTMGQAMGKENKVKFSSCPRGGFRSSELQTTSGDDTLQSEKHSVSFAEDKILENAASFIQRHPNATLLMTKTTRGDSYEPFPDYDNDSDSSDIPESAAELQRQEAEKRSLPNSPQRVVAKTDLDINSNQTGRLPIEEGHKVQTRAEVYSPVNNGQNAKRSSVSQSQGETKSSSRPTPPLSDPPTLNRSPPTTAPIPPPPPPFTMMNTPPPPPAKPNKPPSPSPMLVKPGSSQIAQAVEARRLRMDGASVEPEKHVVTLTPNPQSALMAAVAKRRSMLETTPNDSVVNDIETRLNRSKKLQGAKFIYPKNKTVADTKVAKSPATLPAGSSSKFMLPLTGKDIDIREKKTSVGKTETDASKTLVKQTEAKKSEVIQIKNTPISTQTKAVTTQHKLTPNTQNKSIVIQNKTIPTITENKVDPKNKPIQATTQNKTNMTQVSSVSTTTEVSNRKVSDTINKLNAQADSTTAKTNGTKKVSDTRKISDVNANVSKPHQTSNSGATKKATESNRVIVANKENKRNSSDVKPSDKTKASAVKNNNESQKSSEIKANLNGTGTPTSRNISTAKGESKEKSKPNSSTPDDKVKIGSASAMNNSNDFLALAEKTRSDYLKKKGSPSVENNNNNNNLLLVNGKTKVTGVESSSSDDSVFKLHNNNSRNTHDAKKSNDIIGDIKKSNLKLKGVTMETSSSDNSANNSSDLPPTFYMNESSDMVHIEIIPPPMSFAGSPPGSDLLNTSAFSHDDSGSVHSSLSTLSTLSSEQGDAQHNMHDFIVPPPPPAFGDLMEISDDIPECIPPPPQFSSNGNVKDRMMSSSTFATKNVKDWSCGEVLNWLESLGAAQYKHSFLQQMVDGKRLVGLSRSDYIDLGVLKVGDRMNMERTVKKLAMKQKS